MKEEPELMKYFSDIEEDHLPDRLFIRTILSTLRGEGCKKLIEYTRNVRALDSVKHKDELIEIDPDFLNESCEHHSCQNVDKIFLFNSIFSQGKDSMFSQKVKTK